MKEQINIDKEELKKLMNIRINLMASINMVEQGIIKTKDDPENVIILSGFLKVLKSILGDS